MTRYFLNLTIFLTLCLIIPTESFAQCPTVTDTSQVFCNIESLLISDLEATDNGGGLAWFDSATSTTPLEDLDSLINGVTYFADNATGDCGSRQGVTVTILNAPIGLNFQGVCVEDPLEATIADLEVIGNDVQWYLMSSGGSPLGSNTVLTDETIYYADQSNPNGDCRTSRLAVFVTVGVVPIPTGDSNQQFCANAENVPTVADLVASGINNWYFSLSSASPLSLSTPLVDGNTYFATTIDPPCESTSRLAVTVEIIDQVSAGTDGILEICENDATTFDLFESLNGSPETGGTWSPILASGPGIFDPSVDSEGTYTYTVLSDNPLCEDATAAVTVIIIQAPNAGLDGLLEICENDPDTYDLFDSLNGTPEAGGTWSPTLASGSGIFNAAVDLEGVYTYTITSPTCPEASAEVTVTLAPAPDAGTNGSIEICENETDTFDLFDSLGGTPDLGGTWSPLLNSGTGIFDPSLDSEGTYTYTVLSENSFCEDASATVTVTIIPPPDAGLDGLLEICEDDTNTYDLFDSLNGTPETGGTWSPALASGSGIFNPSLDSEGIYTYTIISNVPACEDASATVTVTLAPAPDAGTNGSIEICENETDIFDLFDSLGGTPDFGGTWSPSLNSGTGVYNPATDSEGTYTYTVLSENAFCEDASATVTVIIIPPPDAGLDGLLEICENDTNTYDLFDSLNGTPETGGIWLPALASGSGIFDPNLDAEGIYTYTIASNIPACEDASAAVTVNFATAPDPGTNGSIEICENETDTFDLFESLGGTPELGGTWSPALNSGTGVYNPALDSEETYTYTVLSENTFCEDASATVTVTIFPPPDAGLDGLLKICENDTNTYDLFDSLNGTPQTGGIWSPALASGSGIFDPTVDTEGIYTYTISSSNPDCDSASSAVTVNFAIAPNPGINGSIEICENETDTFDLFDSLGGTPDIGGTWSPALSSGSGVYNPAVDSEGTYTYTVLSENAFCEDASATVTVTIFPPPDAGLDGLLEICENDTNTYDLFDSLNGTPQTGGIWSPALASGSGIFDPTVDTEGIYAYTISSSNPDCDSASSAVTVNFAIAPNPGINGSLEICENETDTFDLFDSLGGTPDLDGTWSPALSSGSGVYNPAVDSEGVYTYTVLSENAFCEDASATVTVTIIPPPDAGLDGQLEICENDTNIYDLFDSLNGTPQTGGTWSPTLASGTGLFDPNIDAQGIYTYTTASGNVTCGEATAAVIVNFAIAPNAGIDSLLEICEADTSTFDLFDSLGGIPELGGSWSPALNSGTGVFDPAIDAPGSYTYTVLSSNTFCEDDSASVTVAILPPPDAGMDGILEICNNDTSLVDLFTSLNGTPDTGGTWSPALASGTGLFDPAIDIAGVYTYTVDLVLCMQTDASEVTVSFVDVPDVDGMVISITDTCQGTDLFVNISNAVNLIDGDYTINFDVTGATAFNETITSTIVSGEGSFIVNAELFINYGLHQFIINSFTSETTTCNADISALIPVDFSILETIDPILIDEGNSFCIDDNATISSLSNNITNASGNDVEWFDEATGGSQYGLETLLIDGETYYASILSNEGCSTTIRLAVTVNVIECIDDIEIPDGFSPNGDGINETFDIKNLDVLYPNFKLSIYNRYGNTLYEGNINSPKWNGNSNSGRSFGDDGLPVGVYFFVLEFNDGIRKELQGRLYLNR